MKLSLPLKATASAIAIVGATGSGKTFAAKGLLEPILDAGARACVLDPTGAWWGLKSSANGESAGFPVVIFGGSHADIAIDDTSGAVVGKLIAERSMQAVVDISEMTMGGRVRFATAFLEALYHHNKLPLYLVIDEADLFAPQRPMPDQTVMLNRVEQIVRRGRIKGFRPWMITQRPAELHKSVLSQAATLIAMGLRAPQDRDAIGAWIEGQADRDQGKRLLADLPKLGTGTGYVWYPAADFLQKVMFPRIKTFDSSRTPEDGDEALEPVAAATAGDLEEVRALIEKAAQAKADAVKGGASRADLEKEYRRGFAEGAEKGFAEGVARGRADAAGDLEVARKSVIAAVEAAFAGNAVPRATAEPPQVQPAHQAQLLQHANDRSEAPGGKMVRAILDEIHAAWPQGISFAAAATRAGASPRSSAFRSYRSAVLASHEVDGDASRLVSAAPAMRQGASPRPATVEAWAARLSPSYGRMLIAIAKARAPVSARQIAAAAGISETSSGLGAGLRELQSLGLVEQGHERGTYRLVEALE